ncbi:MAG: aspartate/glutamate racemase family protein, partial [Bacillota bacterium]
VVLRGLDGTGVGGGGEVMKRVGLIRVLTTTDCDLLNLHGRQIQSLFPELEVVSRCIPDHPEGVHDEITHSTAVPQVVKLARTFRDEGFDAVIVSCAGDPGVAEAQEEVDIPVIGAGRAAASIALSLGGRVGVLGITERAPDAMVEVLGPAMVAYVQPEGVSTTLDLMREEGKASAINAASLLKQQGAQVIVLACTGLSTIGAAQAIAEATGLKVVDPVVAEGLVAYYAVNF